MVSAMWNLMGKRVVVADGTKGVGFAAAQENFSYAGGAAWPVGFRKSLIPITVSRN